MKISISALILCALLATRIVWSQPSQQQSTPAALNAAAIKAYQAKDYAGFLAYEKQALGLNPANPRIIYNVACGEALQGNAHEAIRLLDQLLARKLDLGAETDTDFSNIRKTPEWAEFESRLAEVRKPVVHSEVAFKLADPAIVATGIAVDPRTGDSYIASVRERKILRRTRQGAVSDFIASGQDDFLAGASLAIDSPRHLLFATTAAAPFMIGYHKEDMGKSGIFAFDLKSGKLVRKAMLPVDGKRHLLNALAVDRHGNVYVSDTGASGIYRLRTGTSELEQFPSPTFTATQGLALSRDERTLYVADYTDGLWAVDMASGDRRHLEAPGGAWLGGLDGLSRAQDGLIAVQIGVKPERVLRLRLDAKGQRVAMVEILEMGHPDYEGPIQGVVAGKDFLYVANSQLDLGNGESGAFASERAHPTIVLRLPL
jgi:sugar lactone lactonase YvrE